MVSSRQAGLGTCHSSCPGPLADPTYTPVPVLADRMRSASGHTGLFCPQANLADGEDGEAYWIMGVGHRAALSGG